MGLLPGVVHDMQHALQLVSVWECSLGETEREKRQLVEDFGRLFADLVLDLQNKWFGAAGNRRKQFRQLSPIYQKKGDVCKISVRISGAGNGCANFMGAWHFLLLSAGKPPMPIKFLFLGGRGVLGFLGRGGGVEVPILFLWVRGFSFLKRGTGALTGLSRKSPRKRFETNFHAGKYLA